MTGTEFRMIRDKFGLSASAMGRALGYSGPKANVAVHIRRLERGDRPPSIGRRPTCIHVLQEWHPGRVAGLISRARQAREVVATRFWLLGSPARRKMYALGRARACRRRLAAPTKGPVSLPGCWHYPTARYPATLLVSAVLLATLGCP